MGLLLDFSPVEEREMERFATREGVSVTEYARRRLLTGGGAASGVVPKSLDAGDRADTFYRSTAKCDAHIAELEDCRASWDDPDYYSKPQGSAP